MNDEGIIAEPSVFRDSLDHERHGTDVRTFRSSVDRNVLDHELVLHHEHVLHHEQVLHHDNFDH